MLALHLLVGRPLANPENDELRRIDRRDPDEANKRPLSRSF